MLEQEIKQTIYNALSSVVPNLTDSAPERPTKTYVLMQFSDAFDMRYKQKLRQQTSYLTFHIFSVYDGEKEVLEIKEKIDKVMDNLYNLGKISYFEMSGFNILLEEKPLKKHGVLRYRILSTFNKGD